MKSNDDLLSVQGTVRTLVDAEGYLVREDSQDGRYRYPISGSTSYTAGSGIILNNNEISIDSDVVSLKSDISNKGKIKVISTPLVSSLTIDYEPNYDVFLNEVTLASGQISIDPVTFNSNQLNNVEEATVENWFTTTNQENVETISIDNSITIVGDIPEVLSGSLTHVFVRRVYKDNSSNIHQAISYAYSF